ncbi:hypothetical protein [Streptomyces pseudogriseolus]
MHGLEGGVQRRRIRTPAGRRRWSTEKVLDAHLDQIEAAVTRG